MKHVGGDATGVGRMYNSGTGEIKHREGHCGLYEKGV